MIEPLRLLCLAPILLCTAAAAASPRDLDREIAAVLSDKALRKSKVGVSVVRIGEGRADATTILDRDARTPLIPASNMKLLTTAAALELLGSDFRFRTALAVRGGGKARDVAIVGDGDPTLGDAEMLRKVGWEVDTVFRNWADVLRKRGVRSVGTVSVDDGVFDQDFVHPSWPAEQHHKRYVAQVGGVNLNANCVDFFLTTGAYGDLVTFRTNPDTRYITTTNACTFGDRNAVWLARELGRNDVVLRGETDASNTEPISVTIHDPPLFAATVLREALRDAGIDVAATDVARDRSVRQHLLDNPLSPEQRWTPLAVHETPLATVLARANKDSMNLYAESLCKRLGHHASGQAGSWENGLAAMGAFLQSLGVSTDQFTLDDGSGLSRKNLLSANAIARVLAHAFGSPNRQAFIDSLSVAGSDGTLEKRFRDSDLRGRVFAKSGYIAGVSALSGYLHARDGQWYAFSILMNDVSDIATAKLLQERIIVALDRAQSPMDQAKAQ